MRVAWFVMILITGGAFATAQVPVTLHGRVVDRDGAAISAAIELVGYGTPLVDPRTGAFEYTLSCSSRKDCDVTAMVINDPELTVVSPFHGRVLLPANEEERVDIVVGTKESVDARDTLATVQVYIEELGDRLESGTVAAAAEARELFERSVASLGVGAAEYADSVESHRDRSAIASELLAAASMYVVRVKDLRDRLKLLAELAGRGDDPNTTSSRNAMVSLANTGTQYNVAFGTIKTQQDAVIPRIRAYWGDRRETVVQMVRSFFEQALTVIHETRILVLTDAPMTVQLVHMGRTPPPGDDIDAALSEIRQTVDHLDADIPVLDARYATLREAMQNLEQP